MDRLRFLKAIYHNLFEGWIMSVAQVTLSQDAAPVSRIIQGMWRLADWNYTTKQVQELIQHCLKLGITTFDHADIYGGYRCEDMFGEALAGLDVDREQIQLVTKCDICLVNPARPEHALKFYDTSREHLLRSAENSLRALHTEYIDVLLLHRPDPLLDAEEVADAFAQLQASGKVRQFGVSNFLPHQFQLVQSALGSPLVTNQIEYSPLEMKHQQDGVIDHCQQHRIRPMAWSPFAGGRLFTSQEEAAGRVRTALLDVGRAHGDASLDQVALAWILRHPVGFVPIIGSGNMDRIGSAVAALQINLSRQQWFAIWQAATGSEVP